MDVKKVLLIEDYPELQVAISLMIKQVFGEGTEVFIAGSLEKADELYQIHVKDIDLILMDTKLGEKQTTFALAKKISAEFNRPIVSTSTIPEYRKKMMQNGCTHECEKYEVLKFLTDWKKQHE